ncbi:hypothetical protein EVAR_60327_1 [Eumeta japonica]|uniref:Uncharacterized protein n=1 Tax=Eumeta variegata TaxID=151549 RepID=A0A4C1Z6X4_EUMVA|nr:hypothetical protein EVAR_60327_1 [Eumeta japonica]
MAVLANYTKEITSSSCCELRLRRVTASSLALCWKSLSISWQSNFPSIANERVRPLSDSGGRPPSSALCQRMI